MHKMFHVIEISPNLINVFHIKRPLAKTSQYLNISRKTPENVFNCPMNNLHGSNFIRFGYTIQTKPCTFHLHSKLTSNKKLGQKNRSNITALTGGTLTWF